MPQLRCQRAYRFLGVFAIVCTSMFVIHTFTHGFIYENYRSISYPAFDFTRRIKYSDIHTNYPITIVSTNISDQVRTLPMEVRHIGFVKVHKAASSTMQNIFFRFGMKRNLTFVFTEHPNYFSRSAKYSIPLVKPRYRNGYDILCNHGIFSHKLYSSLLPNDTVYLGIVRNPLELFVSAVNYYSQPQQSLSYLTRVPGNRVKNLIQYTEKYDPELFSYTRNVMARDFGFEPMTKPEAVIKKITELDRVFKLVLLVEYFEESLILMKRYLSWKLQDILFISNNVYSKTGWKVSDLDPNDVTKLTYRNQLDFQVYNYFYEKFWRQFRSEPEDIHLEVLNFKEILTKLSLFCKDNPTRETTTKRSLTIENTEWNERFVVLEDECVYMKMDEQVFIKKLRTLQGSELGQKSKRRVKRLFGRL